MNLIVNMNTLGGIIMILGIPVVGLIFALFVIMACGVGIFITIRSIKEGPRKSKLPSFVKTPSSDENLERLLYKPDYTEKIKEPAVQGSTDYYVDDKVKDLIRSHDIQLNEYTFNFDDFVSEYRDAIIPKLQKLDGIENPDSAASVAEIALHCTDIQHFLKDRYDLLLYNRWKEMEEFEKQTIQENADIGDIGNDYEEKRIQLEDLRIASYEDNHPRKEKQPIEYDPKLDEEFDDY